MTCCAAFSDWDSAALRPLAALSELTACFSLAYMSRAADALDGLGLLEKVYLRLDAFLDAWEVALPCHRPRRSNSVRVSSWNRLLF